MKQTIKKTFKTALIFLGIGILFGTLIAFAATPSSTFYISSGVYPGAPSYTVWKEGNNYFAKDSSGQIDYSGTNASLVILNVIDTTSNGIIYFLSAEYSLDAPLSIGSNITLRGSGWQTIFKASTDFPDNKGVIRNKEAAVENIVVENLLIDGNKDAGVEAFGISFGRVDSTDSANKVHIRTVYVKDCFYHGIGIRPHCNNTWIIDCVTENNGANGIDIQGASSAESGAFSYYAPHVFNVHIVNCKSFDNDYGGFDVNAGATRVWLINPEATGNNKLNSTNDAAIAITSFSRHIIIENPQIYSNGVSASPKTFGIRLSSNVVAQVKGGYIQSNGLGAHAIWVSNGANVSISGVTINGRSGYNGINFLYATAIVKNPIVEGNTISDVLVGIEINNSTEGIYTGNIIYSATYGILEQNDSDYNIIIGVNTRVDVTNGILVAGANTKVNLCWNSTNWIS